MGNWDGRWNGKWFKRKSNIHRGHHGKQNGIVNKQWNIKKVTEWEETRGWWMEPDGIHVLLEKKSAVMKVGFRNSIRG